MFAHISVYTPYGRSPQQFDKTFILKDFSGLSKSTLYSYLRHRGVEIGPYKKLARQRSATPAGVNAETAVPKVAAILLTLRIQNNSKVVRGRKRTIEHIEREWGRIGQPGTVRETRFATEAEAWAAGERWRTRKEKRGYRAVAG